MQYDLCERKLKSSQTEHPVLSFILTFEAFCSPSLVLLSRHFIKTVLSGKLVQLGCERLMMIGSENCFLGLFSAFGG